MNYDQCIRGSSTLQEGRALTTTAWSLRTSRRPVRAAMVEKTDGRQGEGARHDLHNRTEVRS
jgi:hypothetical protein